MLKPTVLTTTSSYTLALEGLQTGTNADNILVADSNGILKWVPRSTFTGDNLGNHTATQDLNMSSKNINAANNIIAAGKTTTNTVQIKTGTDASVPAAGSIAVSQDANGNVVWKTPAAVIAANQVQGDWNMATTTDPSYIKNKPTIPVVTGAETKIIAGTNVTVSGTGAATTPYVINATSVGDNLGNHTATQTLNMANNNISGAANTSTQTLTIAKGTDGNSAVPGYVATAADNSGNVVWKAVPKQNIVPTDVGTVISINGELVVAQEITVQMTSDFTTSASGIIPIGNINNIIIDNKSKFTSNASGNSFSVADDGIYLITINVQFINTGGGNPVIGIRDNNTGQWVARINNNTTANDLESVALVTSINMVTGRTYSFGLANVVGGTMTIKAYSSGGTGTGPVSFYSLKRLK